MRLKIDKVLQILRKEHGRVTWGFMRKLNCKFSIVSILFRYHSWIKYYFRYYRFESIQYIFNNNICYISNFQLDNINRLYFENKTSRKKCPRENSDVKGKNTCEIVKVVVVGNNIPLKCRQKMIICTNDTFSLSIHITFYHIWLYESMYVIFTVSN